MFGHTIVKIRSDNGSEFKNSHIDDYCDEHGIKHELSSTYTPQQNGVVEKKNKTLITLARSMLDEYGTPERFWAEAINTACYASNRLYLHRLLKKTAYELLFGRKPNVSYFRVFGCKCYIYKKRQHLGKFQRRCDIGFMVRYSANAKAYRVYNESTGIVEETYDVEFDESNERYGGIDGAEDEEEQRRAMKKMPKGEIKPKEDGEELVDQNGSPSTLEEDEDKPLTPQDGQGKGPSSQAQLQAQGQESPPQEQVSPSRLNNQVQATSHQVTPQANTSRPRTRQQANIEAQTQGGAPREEQLSPIRASRLFGQINDE